MLEANELKVPRKIDIKTKNRQNKTPTINEWVEWRRREWGEHVTRMDTGR